MKREIKIKRIALIAPLILLATACTKEKPYKELPKGTDGLVQESKSIIDTNADYLYVPSTVESDRKATSSRPHWMGDARRVRFVFSENDLKVVEPEKDGRFSENPVNSRAVLTMPITHVDYKCQEDDFGKCTHREEENKSVTWDKKKFFVLKGGELALQQLNFLPLEIEKFFGSSCTKEVRSEFIKAEITRDAINLILEKTFQDTCPRAGEVDDAADLSFSVRYQHSFVRLDKVISPNYRPIRYTRSDEGNFGYFSTQQLTLDVDNNDVLGSEKYYFDRWNPERSEVVYYLSQGFNKPANALIKKATVEAVVAINQGLEKAGARLRITLKDPVPGMSSGDIRNNMIVMEEDPQAAGVIGYGPHTANPLTGEIVQAKTIMYLGTMKKYLKYNYDELVREKAAVTASSMPIAALHLPTAPRANADNGAAPSSVRLNHATRGGRPISERDLNIQKLQKFASTDRIMGSFAKDAREQMEFMSRNCMFPGEMVHLEGDSGDGVDRVLDEVGRKPWDRLTDDEKEKVIAALLPFVWKPTLIHELGHNLGLRHNFAGSEDKDNFYSPAELAALGVSRPAAYSSVMDYAYRTNNELRVMGKYDIAALRYGYAEQVETAEGKVISLSELHARPDTELKPYKYCTDEHVSANPNCNRFDEGTTLLEIARHFVKAYQERYTRANFRNSRRKFSLLADTNQAGAIDNMMFELRLAFERYETVKNDFDLADDAPEWESIAFLKDLKAAALTAGNFFLDVIKTPDVLCAVAKAEDPSTVVAVVPIRDLSRRAVTCFDSDNVRLNSQYLIVAEGGKSFQSRKDPNSDNPWADQIDVRGIWIDKMLATHYLLARELGSSLTDKYTENFLHLPEMREPVLKMLEQVLSDEFSGPVQFRTEGGATATLDVDYKLFDATDANNSHKLPAIMDPRARALFGLPDETTLFQQNFIGQVTALMPSRIHARISASVLHAMRAYSTLPNDGHADEYKAVNLQPGLRVFVHKDSALTLSLVQDLETVRILSPLKAEQLDKVLAALAAESAPELTPEETAAKALGKSAVEKFKAGGFQQEGFYSMILQSLAR